MKWSFFCHERVGVSFVAFPEVTVITVVDIGNIISPNLEVMQKSKTLP
jgi:hypothetical protein